MCPFLFLFSMPETSSDQHVIDALCESLGIDEEQCTPGASLNGDLGMESADVLDITFRLDQRFNTRLTVRNLVTDLFDIPLKEFEVHRWAAAKDHTAENKPAHWETAPGTVGRLQEMARKNFKTTEEPA